MNKKFTRTIEDFKCEHCGKIVQGSGYTNHCPYCLWSKHVDINPGDRKCECKGLMEPVDVLQKDGDYVILHQCKVCGFERKNKFQEGDNFDALLEIIKEKK
jgi:rubrerythrin